MSNDEVVVEGIVQAFIDAHKAAPPLVALHAWLSALLIELLLQQVLKKPGRAQEYESERNAQLPAVQARLGSFDKDVEAFRIPVVQMRGPEFLRSAWPVLEVRVEKRKLAKSIVNALRNAKLPHKLWPYLKPQLDLYATQLGIEPKVLSTVETIIRTFDFLPSFRRS